MLYEQHYIKEVDKAMEKLRARCLGQDRKLVEVLSLHMREKATKEQAEQLAGQLLFALVSASYGTHCDGPQQARCRQWLEDLIAIFWITATKKTRLFTIWYDLLRAPRMCAISCSRSILISRAMFGHTNRRSCCRSWSSRSGGCWAYIRSRRRPKIS